MLLTGEKFAVAVKYINSEKNILPLECNTYDSGLSSDADNIYSKATSNVGESFFSKDGETWTDLDGYTYGNNTLKNTSACIKAFSTYSENPNITNVTGVTLNKSTATITAGDNVKLIATVMPTNATNKNVIWTSSDESIATVQNGTVTGLKAGNVTITVTTEDGSYKATCTVTVKAPEPVTIAVTGVTLDKTSAELYVGDNTSLVATVAPANATNKAVTWTSSDTSVATVSNSGVVNATKVGTATITVTTVDGSYKATCAVTVKAPEPVITAVTGVTLNKTSAELYVGDNTSLVATVAPANATNKAVTWTSSDTSVATVSNSGVVNAIKAGETIITVTTADGSYKVTCVVTVKAQEPVTVAATGVSLNKTSAEMYVGDSTSLVATVTPTNATNKGVTWTSSDESVATVSNQGVVTALKTGTSTITATTKDGSYKATCTVTVKAPEPATIAVTGVTLNLKISTMQVGDSLNLVATVLPTNATIKTLKWTSSDTSVATVSEQGIITAVKEGKTTITVSTLDGHIKASCELTVTKKTNNEDDIYTESGKENSNKEYSNNNEIINNEDVNKDNTQITGNLPQTGEEHILVIFLVMVSGVVIISFIKYKNNKDIK